MSDEPKKGVIRAPAPELPAKIEDWERQIKHERTLNDLVEELHRKLWNISPQYRALHNAVWDAQAVEGTIGYDNSEAARLLREYATKEESEVSKEKLATISLALGVVLRRYGNSRKQRRRTVGGEVVPSGDDNGSE